MRITGPIQEVTTADRRVRVDPSVTDRYGIPVAWFSGGVHPRTSAPATTRARGAATGCARRGPPGSPSCTGPSSARAGGSTRRVGRCHGDGPGDLGGRPVRPRLGHDNVRVADGSVHVTNGGVNPVLTVFATAMRTIDAMVRGRD